MSQDDQRAATSATAANAFETAFNAMNDSSQRVQAVAGECFEISQQSFEHASQLLEKLRGARSIQEIMAIQANYVKEAFENAASHARKFGEIMSNFPTEFTKTYQDTWLKAVNTAVETMQTASQTASANATNNVDDVRKSTRVYDHRESA